MTLTFKLERLDGMPAEPPSIESTVLSWKPGDTIPLGANKTLQVVRVRDNDADRAPVLVVHQAVTRLVVRDDRVSERAVFQGFGGDRFRTALTRACTAAGVPAFSPHDFRHRRVSLLHLGGMPWARIGELVGHDDLVYNGEDVHACPR
jgi:integrase